MENCKGKNMKTMNKPTDEEITSFIQEMSPEKSKCLHRDFVNLVGFSILAWVVDASLNKEKGYYIAYYSKYQKGQFSLPKTTDPCRYDDSKGKRTITSLRGADEWACHRQPVITVSDSSKNNPRVLVTLNCNRRTDPQPLLIPVSDSSGNNQRVLVTLSYNGTPLSQRCERYRD